MNKETLLEELNRLLDLGEPLLDVFPKLYKDDWALKLPDNISDEMRWYANSVACRAADRKQYQTIRQQEGTAYVDASVEVLGKGLLGWRAIGVLQ